MVGLQSDLSHMGHRVSAHDVVIGIFAVHDGGRAGCLIYGLTSDEVGVGSGGRGIILERTLV